MIATVKRWLLDCLPPQWLGRLRAWRIRRSIETYTPRVVEHDYGAARLRVFLSDPLAEGWYDRDWPPLPEVESLRGGRLRPGARVFDVGAHQGVVAAILAGVVGPGGQVVAVEASPHNCRAATQNRQLNALSQIEIVQAAVADKPGELIFNARLNGQLDDGSGAGGRLAVPALTLDDLATRFGWPDIVFVDVEGAECLALAGASRVLASGADFFIEVHVGCGLEKLGGSVAAVLGYFAPQKYQRLVRAEHDTAFRPLAEDNPHADTITGDRFFLLALCRDGPGVTGS